MNGCPVGDLQMWIVVDSAKVQQRVMSARIGCCLQLGLAICL
jgi:hypothetical protein